MPKDGFMKFFRIIFSIVFVLGLFASSSFALLFSSTDSSKYDKPQSGLGAFEGDLTYDFDDGDEIATLSITLENTSPESNGGYITAFAFDGLEDFNINLMSSSDNDFNLLTGSIKVQPFGDDFDFGAAISNKDDDGKNQKKKALEQNNSTWLGGGAPQPGIAVGVKETFIFNISGTALDELTAKSFLGDDSAFAVRFRGFEDGGSDKVLAGPPPGVEVPEPTTIFLIGVGLLGLAGLRKKVKK